MTLEQKSSNVTVILCANTSGRSILLLFIFLKQILSKDLLNRIFIYFFSVALRPNAGHGLLILEVFYIIHNDAPQSVGLLWTSDQLVAETST